MSNEIGAAGARAETLRQRAGSVLHSAAGFMRLFSRQRVSPHCALPADHHAPNAATRRALRDVEAGRGLADWENLDDLIASTRGR